MRFCLPLSLLPTLVLSASIAHAQAPESVPAPSEAPPDTRAVEGAVPSAPPPADPQTAPQPSAPPAIAPVPGTLPPPPPGYMYVPAPAAPAQTESIQAELSYIDDRYRQLQAERARYSIAGPMVMTALGFASAAGLGMTSLVFYTFAEDESYYDDEYYYDDYDDEAQLRRIARATGIAAAFGLALGITGTVFLGKRLRGRRQYAPEMTQLKRRKRELLRSLRYSASLDNRQAGLAVSGQF